MKKISIIVPAYNEEEVINLFYNELKNVLNKISDIYKVFCSRLKKVKNTEN